MPTAFRHRWNRSTRSGDSEDVALGPTVGTRREKGGLARHSGPRSTGWGRRSLPTDSLEARAIPMDTTDTPLLESRHSGGCSGWLDRRGRSVRLSPDRKLRVSTIPTRRLPQTAPQAHHRRTPGARPGATDTIAAASLPDHLTVTSLSPTLEGGPARGRAHLARGERRTEGARRRAQTVARPGASARIWISPARTSAATPASAARARSISTARR